MMPNSKTVITPLVHCLIFLLVFLSSCYGQEKQKSSENTGPPDELFSLIGLENMTLDPTAQIAKFVVEVFEDKKGNLWFGTMSKGVARYDGKNLIYFTKNEGLPANTVASIAEDEDGNLWFGTHFGLSKYDGETFTNYNSEDGLCHNRVSNVLIDRKGEIWVGTWGGVCRFNGTDFSEFPIPKPNVEMLSYQSTMNWITEIIEDSQGNIWFGRDGYGACKYDGQTFIHYTKEDGLQSNCIQVIEEDKHGNIWFGSRVAEKDHPDPEEREGEGGLNRYDGKMIHQYPEVKGLTNNDIYSVYEDKSGDIWIGANGVGVYRYDGQNFKLYSETDREDLMPYGYGVQGILEDSQGNMWFGLSGGLFRLIDSSIKNVTQGGQWE